MLIASFLDYIRYERNGSECTVLAYGEDLAQFRAFVEGECGSFEPSQVKAAQVREWMMRLMDEGISPASVNRKLSALRSFYKFLLRKQLVAVDPLLKVEGPKKKKPLPVFLRESEMDKVLDEDDYAPGFPGLRDRLILLMFYTTGMRRSELIGLQMADVDLSAGLVKVAGKRNKQRLIPFGEELNGELRKYIDRRRETVGEGTTAFFVKDDGSPVTASYVYNMVKQRLGRVVTHKKRSPHVLRHTFATNMLNHEAQLVAVKDLLGHASLATTQVYTHTTFEELKKVYEQAHPRA